MIDVLKGMNANTHMSVFIYRFL